MKSLSKNDQVLAGLIFILWSFGLVFTPYANVVFASAAPLVALGYLVLHILVFAYTLHTSLQLKKSVQTKKLLPQAWMGRAALYCYVLLALSYSASLLIKFF